MSDNTGNHSLFGIWLLVIAAFVITGSFGALAGFILAWMIIQTGIEGTINVALVMFGGFLYMQKALLYALWGSREKLGIHNLSKRIMTCLIYGVVTIGFMFTMLGLALNDIAVIIMIVLMLGFETRYLTNKLAEKRL